MAIVYTQPRARVIALTFNYALFTGTSQSQVLKNPDGTTLILKNLTVLSMTLDKITALNAGTLSLGNGTSGGGRTNIATTAEFDALVAGTVVPTGWRSVPLNNLIRSTADQRIYARYEGAALPTAGSFILHLQVLDW